MLTDRHPLPRLSPQTALARLAQNLWWSWDPEATALFESLDPELWAALNHNPVALLHEADLPTDAAFARRVESITDRFDAYMADTDTWASRCTPTLGSVAYLSMEFGTHESVRIYSGGLGVLAGDHVRSASDLGIDLVGVGLLYRHGYFRQLIDDGRQVAAYPDATFERLPLRQVGRIELMDGCSALIWELWVGRCRILLLDTDHDGNAAHHRAITSSLYGGDSSMRIRQELVLGIGGIRALQAMGIEPDVLHMNEGHCAFAPMELVRQRVERGEELASAEKAVKAMTVFTTHTPVPAGHDRFDWSLVGPALATWRQSVGWSDGVLMDRGRVVPSDLDEPLNMTILAMNCSRSANGVSELHGKVSRRMFPGRTIGHVTNGVHPLFWMAPEMQALLDVELPDWRENLQNLPYWEKADCLSDVALTSVRNALRARLAERAGLDPTRLVLGFARRFAPYKRANLLFSDPERLSRLCDAGLQVVFSGKAHPRDENGKALVADVIRWSRSRAFRGRVVFLEDYDISLGRLLTQGADVWLNNPRRPREASGTSGQKVVLNGGLNCSVLDGWWPEGFDGTNGWAIGLPQHYSSQEEQDAADAADLYRVLEDEVMPQWGTPAWMNLVRRSMVTGIPRFNTHRMVGDYARQVYTAP
jgi:glycogen phosphorylase